MPSLREVTFIDLPYPTAALWPVTAGTASCLEFKLILTSFCCCNAASSAPSKLLCFPRFTHQVSLNVAEWIGRWEFWNWSSKVGRVWGLERRRTGGVSVEVSCRICTLFFALAVLGSNMAHEWGCSKVFMRRQRRRGENKETDIPMSLCCGEMQ